nr:hypothetical protein [Tanacetum cinerariifolium]
MEDTMFDLFKICHHKQFLCIHDDVDDLIKSALNSKLLLINSNYQRLDKKEQEVKNVVEQQAEHGNRSIQSLQNFKVVHKSSISSKNTSQISSIHSVVPIQSTKEPEHLLSRGRRIEIYSNPLCDEDKINSDKLDPHCFNVESDFVESLLNRDTFIDFSSKFDFSGELAHVNPEIPKSDFDFEEEIRFIENLLYDNSFPRPPEELNAEIIDTIIESIPLLPIPVQDEGDVRFLEELLIDDSILSHESSDSNFKDNPLISGPPPEPPDDNFDFEPEVISAVMEDIDEPDEHFNPGREILVSTNNKDVDYFPFMFVIRIFLPYLILPEISPLLLSAKSEDTIFDPGISD